MAIIINGSKIHAKRTKRPTTATRTWKKIPAIIKNVLIMAPIILEKMLEISVVKNSPKSNAFGYLQLYLFHGEKKVFNRRIREK